MFAYRGRPRRRFVQRASVKRKRDVAVSVAAAEYLESRRLLAGTGLIDVQFNVTGDMSYTNPAQVGAAVIGAAGNFWNQIKSPYFISGQATSPVSGSGLSLLDSDGNSTSVKLSYTAQFASQSANGPVAPFAGTSDQDLMTAYLTANSEFGGTSTSGSVTLSGLTPGGNYQLFFESGGNENG
jgi:hypothetical protein